MLAGIDPIRGSLDEPHIIDVIIKPGIFINYDACFTYCKLARIMKIYIAGSDQFPYLPGIG